MPRTLVIALLLPAVFLFSGCFFSVGNPTAVPEYESVKGYGLGANAPTDIWTDGPGRTKEKPLPLMSDTYINLAKAVGPAEVSIFTSTEVEAGIGIGLFNIPMPNQSLRVRSLGTGFLISDDGFILTNYHVIRYADDIQVYLGHSNEVQPIKVVGVDPVTDVALLKITREGSFPHLNLADSDRIEVGEHVVAVGNPFGLEHSLTTGVVSATNRTLSPGTKKGNFEQYIQTSALINPGNSGGPLLNLYGEVIGINTAIIAHAQGIGFAIPINLVKDLIPDLVRKGRVDRGYLGFTVADLSPILAQQFEAKRTKGVMILRVDRNGPADKAGLRAGDILVSLDGAKVKNALDSTRKISLCPPGKIMKVEVLRGGQVLTYDITTGEL